MSKNVAMFVDVANMYYAARGQDVDVDYVALLKHVTKGRDLIRAYAYTGLDPENESQRKFIDFLGKHGYKAVVKDIRKFGDGRVKANLDIELVVDLFRLATRMDIAVIVSGDGDFAPAIRALQDIGVRCEVVSFKPNTSSDLIAVADDFTDIMKVASISRKRGEGSRAESAGMATPEMPAKEVVPEFGFREASPAVAAAALAAIKTGSPGRTDTRVRRPRRLADAPAEEAPAAVAAGREPLGTDDDQPRRRRRRRGGRGRGRGRGEVGTAAAAGLDVPGEAGEIGWQELDDVSQLEELGAEREYGFEEADEATLRELGLLDAGAPAPVEATAAATTEGDEAPSQEPVAEAAASPPRRRASRARTTKAAEKPSDEAEADAASAEAEKPKRTTRGRATKATTTAKKPRTRKSVAASGDADAAAEPETPKRRTTRRTSPSSKDGSPDAGSPDASAAGEALPQGIWGRFRSARGTRGS